MRKQNFSFITVVWSSLALVGFLLSTQAHAAWPYSAKKIPEQTLTIQNHQGEPLRAYLWLPENYNPEQQYKAVVMAHGCGGAHYKDHPSQWSAKYLAGKYKVWGKLLNQQNMLVLLVDSFTTRDEGGDVGGGVCQQDYASRPAKIDPIAVRPADIAAGIFFLKQRADVMADKIGVLGFSNGGTSVLALANHQDLDARALSLLQQQKSWYELAFMGAYQAQRVIALYPGCGMNGYSQATQGLFSNHFETYTPTTIYAASDDNSLPADTLEKCTELSDLDAGLGDMQLKVVANTGHQFDYYENNEAAVIDTMAEILADLAGM